MSTVERGAVRPRGRMLADLAQVLDPDGTAHLLPALVDLAGESLRPDTIAGLRRRRRRVAAVRRRRAQLARQANLSIHRAEMVLDGLISLQWSKGVLARTDLRSVEHQLEIFSNATSSYDRLRNHAASIGEHLSRRPSTTSAAVITAVSKFVDSTGRTMRARHVADRQESQS